MKIRLPLLALLCSLAALPVLRAEDAAPKKMSADKEDETELGDKMDKMGGAFRKLGKQINDATKNEDSLKLVATMRASAEDALKLEPAKKADIPADQQAKFVADYQTQIKGLIADIDKLDAALKAGNNTDAAALLKDLKKDMDDGHKEFRKKKKKKE